MPIDQATLFKYKGSHESLIETGTYRGGTVELALRLGFKNVYSIELAPHYYEFCRYMFGGDARVNLWLGSSEELLPKLLSKVSERCLIWLDGHYSAGNTALGAHVSPLYEELAAIEAHAVKTHTILIDDMRCVGKEWPGITRDGLLERLMRINPGYKIDFEPSAYDPQDILTAVAV